ncbi:lysozyme inhibitor LprI family protein [Colwellia ponticola]|uniref:DUF1311 domain-containing protein n=1 Tax=Colwellia ponticola TaxID=2304625 RepID=A0A8H2PJF8_9GAMM|nr:lysozyme inhibitor LprI family protein [Colwellia ponticola]TMM43286.1 DUF1311 domain-containing protein [Colwellia ponticola]
MIRNKKLFSFALLCSLLITLPVQAAKTIEECQTQVPEQSSSAAMSRCLDSVIAFVDRELQTWINLHSFNLEEKALIHGPNAALKIFKRSQSSFITYRENDCRWQYLAILPNTGADLAYKTCYVLLSKSRIAMLSTAEAITGNE